MTAAIHHVRCGREGTGVVVTLEEQRGHWLLGEKTRSKNPLRLPPVSGCGAKDKINRQVVL